jgi:hypothetical protein
MNRKSTERVDRALLLVLVTLLTGFAAGCAHRLHVPVQPDGWSAQPVVIACRFAPDADLDPATGTPVGDEGYSLYIMTEPAHWDFSDATPFLYSILLRPSEHSWIILESPRNRLEVGHTGNFGREQPAYHEGVIQRIRDGDPNPIAYVWQTMSDGQFQSGKPSRPPTFAWRMPITRQRHERIHEYVMQRKYDQFGVRTNNCTDLVVEAAALAGINLIHRIHITFPSEVNFLGQTLRAWTDPQYRILEFSTPDVLEVDLRQLAQLGIGSDVTEWYLALKD